MQPISSEILLKFDAVLEGKAVPFSARPDYRKWLRYYLDFKSKYPLPESRSEHIRLFIEKLQQKNQTPQQQKQAAHALSLFFVMMNEGAKAETATIETPYPSATGGSPLQVSDEATPPFTPVTGGSRASTRQPAGSRFNEWRCLAKTASPEWDTLIDGLAAEIKTRHYSRKTLKTYADWSRKFQSFLHDKPPEELSSFDVREYLTYLAVTCKVSASTQNQAFNSLLFLYRHILKKDFGDHKDIPRAKKSRYIPVVLSRREIDSVLKNLSYPYALVVKLLYGCGLRLFEGVQLRVHEQARREILNGGE